jgi:hypothetical protein
MPSDPPGGGTSKTHVVLYASELSKLLLGPKVLKTTSALAVHAQARAHAKMENVFLIG